MALPAYYYATPSLNVSINGINIGEGMARSDMNNALRQLMADLKVWTDASSVTYPISIANGGTGQASAAAALTALNGLDASFRDLVRIDKSSNFIFADTERGSSIAWTAVAGTATINLEATTPITPGAFFRLYNGGSGNLSITRASGTIQLYKNGATSSSDATLAPGGIATLVHEATNHWTITGVNLT